MKKYKITREEQRAHECAKRFEKAENTLNRERERLNHIKKIKEIFPTAKTVICIGARHDSEVICFEGAGFDAYGIDFACAPGYTGYIEQLDAHELDQFFEENEFDIAYCSHCLEHMYDPPTVLSNIRKVTSQGMFVVLPCKGALGKSHCSVFDIMAECESDNDNKLYSTDQLIKRSDLWKDFEDAGPFNLLSFERSFGWHEKEASSEEMDFILGWK